MEAIDPIESFHNGFYYFVSALETLAKDADAQCEKMGDFNVAWELVHDVSPGRWLAANNYGQLSEAEATAIIDLCHSLRQVPVSQLPAGAGRAKNLEAMQHVVWVALRSQAASVLSALGPAIQRNQGYLGLLGTVR